MVVRAWTSRRDAGQRARQHHARCCTSLTARRSPADLRSRGGAPIEHVIEPAPQPGLSLPVVGGGVCDLVDDMGVVSSQTSDFLLETKVRLTHQILIAEVPQIVAVCNR